MTITADYQLEIADSAGQSLLLGESTSYLLRQFEGLGTPEIRASDSPRPRDHGVWVGSDYLDARQITITTTIVGTDAADALEKLSQLKALWFPDTDPMVRKTLTFRWPGEETKQVEGRTRRISADLTNMQHGIIGAVCEFVANDSVIVSATQKSVRVLVSSTTGGRTYSRTYNVTYGGVTTGSSQATNNGTIAAQPTIVLTGPLTNPRVENTTTGEQLALEMDLESNAQLVVNFADRTVLLGGYASRYYALTAASTWWTLAPGANTIRLFDAGTGTGAATLSWRDTWL